MENEEVLIPEVYDRVRFALIAASGDILSIGECPADELDLQAQETGQFTVIDPPANVFDDTHYYKGGAFKLYPARPTPAHEFNYTTETWVDGRSADKNLDFSVADYTIEPVITVSGNTLSYTAFTAIRDNGVYSESKAKTAGTVTFAGTPVLVAYNYDANTVTTYANYASMNASPRRFLLGEFKATGFFIPAANLVNGATVAANTVGTPQLAPLAVTKNELATSSVIPSKLADMDTDNMIPDDQFTDPDAWYGAYTPNGFDIFEMRIPTPTTNIQTIGDVVYFHSRNTLTDVGLVTYNIPVEPLSEVFLAVQAIRASGTKMRFQVSAHFYDVKMASVEAIVGITFSGTANTTKPYTGTVKIPATARIMRVQIRVIKADTDGNIVFGALTARRMQNTELIVDRAITDIMYATANTTTNIATLNFTLTYNSKLLIISHVNPTTTGGIFDFIVKRNGVEIYKTSWVASTNIAGSSAEESFFRYQEVLPGAISIVMEGPVKTQGLVKGITVLEAKK